MLYGENKNADNISQLKGVRDFLIDNQSYQVQDTNGLPTYIFIRIFLNGSLVSPYLGIFLILKNVFSIAQF